MSDFPQQLRRRNAEVPDVYFTLLDVSGMSEILVLNQNTKAKERKSWFISKLKCQKLQILYVQGGGAYGSLRILLQACILPV